MTSAAFCLVFLQPVLSVEVEVEARGITFKCLLISSCAREHEHTVSGPLSGAFIQTLSGMGLGTAFLCNNEAQWAKAMLGPRKPFISLSKYRRVEFNQVVSVVTKTPQRHPSLLGFFTSVWLFI